MASTILDVSPTHPRNISAVRCGHGIARRTFAGRARRHGGARAAGADRRDAGRRGCGDRAGGDAGAGADAHAAAEDPRGRNDGRPVRTLRDDAVRAALRRGDRAHPISGARVTQTLLLVFARSAGLVARAPGVSHPSVPPYVRLGFALAIAFAVAPHVAAAPALDLGAFTLAVAGDFAIGA